MIMMGCTGIAFSSAGIFFTPVATELGIGLGQLTIWMTVALLSMFFILPFAGRLFAGGNIRVLLTAAVSLVGLSLITFSFATSEWLFYIVAVPLGFGLAITGYLAVPTLLNRWFKTRVGFFMGVCMAFSGVGGVIFNQVGGAVINSPGGWRMGYVVLGICTLALTLPFTLFVVRNRPEDVGLKPYGASDVPAAHAGEAPAPAKILGVSSKVAMGSLAFVLLALFTALVGFGTNIYQYMPSYARSLELATINVGLAATLGSFAMGGQAIGKVALGAISDKSVVAGITISMICGAAGLLTIWLIPDSEYLIYAAGFFFGIFYAAALVLVPLMARTIFGLREYEKIYSRISMVSALVSAFAVSILGFVSDATGSFDAIWLIGLGIAALSLVLGVSALAAGKKLVQTES
jgi:MFS family permease